MTDRDLFDTDDINRATERRKRKNDDPDEVVDLDSLVREYEERYSDPRSRLAEPDGEELPKRKNDDMARQPRPQYERERDTCRSPENIGEAMGRIGEEIGRIGGKFGEEMGKLGETVGQEFGKGFGKSFGKRVERWGEDLFSRPYEPGYRSVVQEQTTPDERNWGALAHASAFLTLVLGGLTLGGLVPITVFIPLLIYLNFRDKSHYVAQHALQAFVAQLAGTLGWIALVIASGVVGVLLTILLAITIVGIIAIPFLWIALVLFWVVSLAMPLGMFLFGGIGTFAALGGRNFKYPFVGKFVSRSTR